MTLDDICEALVERNMDFICRLKDAGHDPTGMAVVLIIDNDVIVGGGSPVGLDPEAMLLRGLAYIKEKTA